MNEQVNNVLIIKVGTSTLTKRNHNGRLELDVESFDRLGKQVVDLQRSGHSVAIVSSAAITAGMVATGTASRPTNTEDSMPTLQGLASVGWRHVLNAWDQALDGRIIGELLITRHELEIESERSELLRVTHNLMTNGYIVIINENDAITHEEIAFGDNDTLASTFASKVKQSELFEGDVSVVVLTDVDGVYMKAHRPDTLIAQIEDINTYSHVITESLSDGGTGGMTTKFAAARISKDHGVDMYIANGRMENVLNRTLAKETGTYFKK